MGPEVSFRPVYRFLWEKRSFKRGSKMDFPKGTIVFGLAVGDSENREHRCSGAGEFGTSGHFLHGRKISWTSRAQYGGTNNFYDTKKSEIRGTLIEIMLILESLFPGRVVVRDLDQDGIEEIIVTRNESPTSIFGTIENLIRRNPPVSSGRRALSRPNGRREKINAMSAIFR